MTFGTSARAAREPRRPRPRRSAARLLVPVLVAAYAVLEIWLLTVVAGHLGAGPVLLLLLAGLVCGALAVKRAGRRAWEGLAASVRAAAPAGRDRPAAPVDPAAPRGTGTAMLGGLLLIIPGFVSDAAGLLCLFPPTRRLLGAAGSRLARRPGRGGGSAGTLGDAFRQARMRTPDGKVVPGEVVRDREDGRRRPDDGTPKPPLTS